MQITRWIVGLLVVVGATIANAEDDLSFDDVPLGVLIERLLSEDEQTSSEAVHAIDRRFGTAYVHFEYDWWRDDARIAAHNRFTEEMRPFIPRIIRALSSDHPETRQTACYLLAELGPQSEEVVRAVWESRPARGFLDFEFEDDESEDDEISEFWYLQNDLLYLKSLVPDELPVMSLIVPRVRELCEKQDSPQILDIVTDDDPGDETSMDVRTLGTGVALYYVAMRSSGWGPVEVPGLVELTKPEFPRTIRLWAIMVLANMGPDAISAEPLLVNLVESEDSLLRSLTARALLSFRMEDADVDTILSRARLAQDDEDDIRSDYSEYMSDLEEEQENLRNTDLESARETVEYLRRTLKHARGSLRLDACRRLTELSEYAQSALPELREAQSSPEPLLRELATQAIEQILAADASPRGN